MEKKIKLTKRQKEVIGMMRSGARMEWRTFFSGPSYCWLKLSDGSDMNLASKTYRDLSNLGLVDTNQELTDLGKTIEL